MKIEYRRPYCKFCKIIWGKKNIGLVLNCTKCKRSLSLKSFNPWPKTLGGVTIFILAGSTIFLSASPIMWFGGFFLGASLVGSGTKQWSDVKKLDN